MWCVVVTLATVGYGDFFPKSFLGRMAGMIICFWGTFIVSYFVVTVTNMLSFDGAEQKSYTLLQRLHFKEELKIYAVNVLSSAFKHKYLVKKYDGNEENSHVKSAKRKLRGNTLQFQHTANKVRMYYDGETESDILLKLIDTLREDIDRMKSNQTDLNQ